MHRTPNQSTWRCRAVVATLALALAVAACGGDDDDGDETGSPATEAPSDVTTPDTSTDVSAPGGDGGEAAGRACALLEADELEAVLGGPVRSTSFDADDAEGEKCLWARDDGTPGNISLVFLLDDQVESFDEGANPEPGGIVVRQGTVAFRIFSTADLDDATFRELADAAAGRL
jgi:hypothetical protein